MIEGKVVLGFFEDSGAILQTLEMEANRKKTFLYRLSAPYWHTVVPLTEFAIFHEVSTGPFLPSEYPEWEPENTPEAIHSFQQKLIDQML